MMTLLSPANGKRATKAFERLPNGDIARSSYPNAREFYVVEREWRTLGDLVDLLEEAEEDGHWFGVRGRLKAGLDRTQPHLRRLHDREDDGTTASFEAVPGGVRWVCIDIDNLPNEWSEPHDRQESEALSWGIVRRCLPECFHGAAYWYQWSNSMALDGWDLLKIHLWYLLSEPVPDDVLQQWAQTTEWVDDAPFRTIQPNYIGRPEFKGMADPLSRFRSGLVADHAQRVDVELDYEPLPNVDVWHENAERARQQQERWRQEGKRFFEVDLSRASPGMARIAEIGVNGRLHMPITRSAASWVRCGHTDREEWKRLVRERIALTAHPEKQSRSSDAYLNAQWRSAEQKYGGTQQAGQRVPPELAENRNTF